MKRRHRTRSRYDGDGNEGIWKEHPFHLSMDVVKGARHLWQAKEMLRKAIYRQCLTRRTIAPKSGQPHQGHYTGHYEDMAHVTGGVSKYQTEGRLVDIPVICLLM